MSVQIITGDCLNAMRGMADCSVDAVVTDPPYGLSFMGKKWDYDVPSVEVWAECLRVLKPGGYLLAFAGTRTQHRMAVRIEDAGFEIRDMIAWVYGSGFPKSHNGEWGGTALKPALEPITMARKPLIGTVEANWREHGTGALNIGACRVETGEPLRVGSGGIPCRHNEAVPRGRIGQASAECRYTCEGVTNFAATPGPRGGDPLGRWPANLIHDGSHEVRSAFPDAKGQQGDLSQHANCRQSPNGIFGGMRPALDHVARVEADTSAARFFYCAKASKADRNDGCDSIPPKQYSHDGRETPIENAYQRNSSNSSNSHPTVKPTDLMRYLCRLVTPPGGVVLDPFMGSGSTGKAAVIEGFGFVGIERDAEYAEIAKARIAAATMPLFAEVAA